MSIGQARARRNRITRKERQKHECDRSGFVYREGDGLQDRGITVSRRRNMKDWSTQLDRET